MRAADGVIFSGATPCPQTDSFHSSKQPRRSPTGFGAVVMPATLYSLLLLATPLSILSDVVDCPVTANVAVKPVVAKRDRFGGPVDIGHAHRRVINNHAVGQPEYRRRTVNLGAICAVTGSHYGFQAYFDRASIGEDEEAIVQVDRGHGVAHDDL